MATLSVWLISVPAQATPVTLDFQRVGHGALVTLTGPKSGTFFAGELNWQWVGGVPEGFDFDFFTYCVDIYKFLEDPQDVSIGSTNSLFGYPIAQDGAAKAAWLFNTYAAGIRKSTGFTANYQAAGLQVSIWEALYDASFDLGNGQFRAALTGDTYMWANQYLGSLYFAVGAYHTSTATLLLSSDGQDQITARVPEPATLMLLMLGTAFVAGGCRRR
jgi:hypothetical protein